ncbi:unnamed protein product [Peniophora sp. CBMAI 1063]|nr:unnamed protein product [Peniophora sp. CBMAI 1063]
MGRARTTSTTAKRPEHTNLGSVKGVSKSTPVLLKLQSIVPNLSDPEISLADDLYDQLSNEMRGQFLGPMPVVDMLSEHLPCEEKRTCADINIRVTAHHFDAPFRPALEDLICKAINGSGVLKHLYFIDTHNTVLRLSQGVPEAADRKVDISAVYRSSSDVDPSKIIPSFSNLRLAVELKLESQDIVVDPRGTTPEERQTEGFEHQVLAAIRARGQLAHYALQHFQHQERSHVWSLVFIGLEARLLRFDHSGVLVSERFDWTTGSTLTEILWRLDRSFDCDAGLDEGVDTSVVPLQKDDSENVEGARAAFAVEKEQIPYPLTDETPLRKVYVWDDSTVTAPGDIPQKRALIAAPAHHHSNSPVGRFTMCYPAYDLESESVCWVKEAWRLDEPGFEKESETYATLAKLNGMGRHIPEILCAGDVRDEKGEIRVTRTQDYLGQPWAALAENVHRYVHFRIVFKTIGRPLTTFKNTRELIQVLKDVLDAHYIAYKFGKILHRDISIGNVLIGKDGRGLLIDWDMCKRTDATKSPRRPWRTGTWQFISVELLMKPNDTTHRLRDDLESIFWLLLYVVLRYHYRLPSLDSDREDPGAQNALPTINEGFVDSLYDDASSENDDDDDFDPPAAAGSGSHMDWSQLQAYVHYLFDDSTVRGKAVPTGGVRKRDFICGGPDRPDHPSDAQIGRAVDDAGRRMPPPLAQLVANLRQLFRPVYKDNDVAYAQNAFKNSKLFAAYFNQALQSGGWLDDDAAEPDHFVFKSPSRQPESSRVPKREREEDEYDDCEPEALKARSTGVAALLRRSKRVALSVGEGSGPRSSHIQSAPTALGSNGLPR